MSFLAKKAAQLGKYSQKWYSTMLPNKSTTIEKFQFPQKTHNVLDLSKSLVGSSVTLHGWIDKKPKKLSNALVFSALRDSQEGHVIQLVGTAPDSVGKLKKLKPEDAVAVVGTVALRDQSGDQVDVNVDELYVLNAAGVTGSQLESAKLSNSEYKQEQRYLELRQAKFQNILKKRSLCAMVVRHVLCDAGFTEIETPLLFKSTPEGAREFLVPTRKKNAFYALPQSPQQYKQLLMASGVSRYFQIAKCFRDEDLRADRQPEFTQIDMELAFAVPEDVQSVVEKLVVEVWQQVRGLHVLVPQGDKLVQFDAELHQSLPKMTYLEALCKYGIDKPDLRSSLEFVDVSEHVSAVENPEFPVVEVCVLRDVNSSVGVEELTERALYKARVPFVYKIDDTGLECLERVPFAQFKRENLDALKQTLQVKQGDIIAVSTRAKMPYENPTPLGRFRQLAIQKYPGSWKREIVGSHEKEEDIFVAHWMVDFPLFSPAEKENEGNNVQNYPVYTNDLESTHHPFTMLKPEDYDYLQDPAKYVQIRGDHYDLVINGVEVGGGSRRVHDPELQRFIFEKVLKISHYERLFGHLLKAFESGCPPHAGLAIGFDRMVAMLLGQQSIRNVIAFPKNQNGVDAVVGSPSKVESGRLKEYHVRVV